MITITLVVKWKGHCLYIANLNVLKELFCPEQIAASLTKFTISPLRFEVSKNLHQSFFKKKNFVDLIPYL